MLAFFTTVLGSQAQHGKMLPPVLLLAMLSTLGCGGPNEDLQSVTGSVTFEGQPLDDGRILFTPEQPSAAPVMAVVDQGQFTLELPPGAYRVEIDASRIAPNQEGLDGLPSYVSYIPARYNQQSELTATVTSGGSNHLTFQLHAP